MGFPVKSQHGNERPVNPPSVFDSIPTSSIPSQPPPLRPTNKCRFEERTRQEEKEFGKLRQGSGGTYFITVQQIIEKLDIKKARLLLKLNVNPADFRIDPGHSCDRCLYQMDDKTIDLSLIHI